MNKNTKNTNTIAIVTSEYHSEITSAMEEAALEKARKLKLHIIKKLRVPGVFEIPFAVDQLLQREDIQAVVTIGAVIQGETDHDKIIAHSTARKLHDISLHYGKPVSLGISGPRISKNQAKERASDYGQRAVHAIFKLLQLKIK